MTCKAILGNLVPCQMELVKFEIIDIYIWWDLTFEPAKQLLENMESTTRRPCYIDTRIFFMLPMTINTNIPSYSTTTVVSSKLMTSTSA